MKNMKNILNKYVYLSLFLALSLVISSCSDDDNFGSDVSKVIPLISGVSGEAIAFVGDTYTYTLSPYRGGSEYNWVITGADMAPVAGRPDQISITFTQFAAPVSLSVNEIASNGSTSSVVTTNITVFGTPCDWILETSDTYGDGWNGGYVEVAFGGTSTQYAQAAGAPNTFNIGVPDGIDYTITYVSGGGTGAGPGWESENYFKLTAPDGTVWEEGTMDYSGIPTAGVIVTGTNACP